MKNKKAFLLGEFTLKTIIAVISLSLLLYLLFLIYGAFVGMADEKIEKADSTLSAIIEKIGKEVMPKGSAHIVLTEPKGELAYFSEGNEKGECERLCLCLTLDKLIGKGKTVCKYAEGVVLEEGIKIDNPADLFITLTDNDKPIEEWKYVFTTD